MGDENMLAFLTLTSCLFFKPLNDLRDEQGDNEEDQREKDPP
jgi:hypothetical protein